MASEYLLTHEVARLLGKSPETVRLYEKLGKLPAIRTASGVRLFPADAVARLVEIQAQEHSEHEV